uniref:AlNc14C44G3630 protein n=1 Tax=Albugo laibachii Nc14 TaxID=890382 RepID=F0WAA1_9STRA|nr:AlNc14C44G3630 [Albugo laibachii Nc14]|eukprot:CCA18071.1 AlNc14C44G3630 [Albugo laibachii Nc14]
MDVDGGNNVFFVKVYDDNFRGSGSMMGGIMTVLVKSEHESDSYVQCDTLFDFHRHLGHLCYDTIIKMARDPTSGINLTNTKRESCLACARRKKPKTYKQTVTPAKTRQLMSSEE